MIIGPSPDMRTSTKAERGARSGSRAMESAFLSKRLKAKLQITKTSVPGAEKAAKLTQVQAAATKITVTRLTASPLL